MEKVLAFTLDNGSEVVFPEINAVMLCECLVLMAQDKEWNATAFREMLAMCRSPGVTSHLAYDYENTRNLYNLVTACLTDYTKSTVSTISMIFRWQRKNPNAILENPPPLIVNNQTEFECVTHLCALVGKLAEAVRTGSGVNVHTKAME